MARLIGASKSSSVAALTAGNKAAADLRVFLNGGLINQGSAPGAWTIKEQFRHRKANTWAGRTKAICSAAAQPGGTMTINCQPLGSYDYTYYNGPKTVSSFSRPAWFTSTQDSRSALIYVNGNLTINADQIFKPAHRKLFTAIYVKGDLTVNGAISMGYDYPASETNYGGAGKGANHSPSGSPRTAQAIRLIAPGTYSCITDPEITAAGGAGGSGAIVSPTSAGVPNRSISNTGSNGSGGGTGGGGSGNFFVLEGVAATGINPSGAGTAGTAFTGGTGGGGVDKRAGGTVVNATSGTTNGGAGGAAGGSNNGNANGGNGNPGGKYSQQCTSSNAGDNGEDGTAGSLVVYVSGAISGSGDIISKGAMSGWRGTPIGTDSNCNAAPGPSCSGGNNYGQGGKEGGSGGGGHVTVFYGTDSFGCGSVDASAMPTYLPSCHNPYHPGTGGSTPAPYAQAGTGIAGGNGTARKLAASTG